MATLVLDLSNDMVQNIWSLCNMQDYHAIYIHVCTILSNTLCTYMYINECTQKTNFTCTFFSVTGNTHGRKNYRMHLIFGAHQSSQACLTCFAPSLDPTRHRMEVTKLWSGIWWAFINVIIQGLTLANTCSEVPLLVASSQPLQQP